jgi:hypothetical protein
MADTWIRTGGRASGTQLAGGFVTGALIGAGGALVTPVFLAARTGGRLALLSFGGAAGLIGIGKAVEENNPQLAVYRALVLGLLSSLSASAAEEGNVRVYRVESDQNARVIVGEAGEVLISPTDNMLFLNFGQRSRAEQFLAQRRATTSPGLGIKSFEVPRDYLNELRESAVPESLAHCNPDRPLAVDINKAPDQLGLRPDQIMKLIHEIIQGTGQVEP